MGEQLGGRGDTKGEHVLLLYSWFPLFFFSSEYVFEHVNPQVLCCPDGHFLINLGTYFGKYWIY